MSEKKIKRAREKSGREKERKARGSEREKICESGKNAIRKRVTIESCFWTWW